MKTGISPLPVRTTRSATALRHPPEFLSMLPNRYRPGPGTGVSREDHELLAYATAWAPFGGPSAEDLLLRFGMSPSRFRTRVREIVARRDRYAS
ncbi:hypothetical protein [Prescottella agglutinans]|uniref:DUF3263 domain-containing protein n=1 Tax=Prescottella agglutinans TaxID=1644129 RepID=A0ABT6M710_9NOCA|nr:hypothetical protein [Prescottella agglutinans]MDH6280096.1 hypothetical protein [Prescottella agglutinans]